jgi:hypothetical protein
MSGTVQELCRNGCNQSTVIIGCHESNTIDLVMVNPCVKTIAPTPPSKSGGFCRDLPYWPDQEYATLSAS